MSYYDHFLPVFRPTVCPSIRSHLWTTFSETTCQIFFKLHVEPSVKGGLQICTNGPCPLIYNFPEPGKLWGWILVCRLGDSRSTKCVQMMIGGWPLIFLRLGQVCVTIDLYGTNVEQLLLWNPGPFFFTLHVGPSVKGILKICTNGYAMPIYGTKTLKSSPEPIKRWTLSLVYNIGTPGLP